jgi:5-methyltetrahydropteroyltriglutamate--homocysteine methyltransferase
VGEVACAFTPATASTKARASNEYYKSDEEYFHALAAGLSKEYRAIVDAGILVQIDDPFLPDIFYEVGLDDVQKKRRAQIYVEAINTALKGIPPEYVRFHACYGINEGPRLYEAALADIIDYMLKIDAGSYSFEAANPRHEHEYHLFESVKVPDGKVLVPGVVTHASNIRRASGIDRRAHHPLCKPGRPRERHRRRRLRLLIASHVQHRSASHRGVGEVQGDAARRRPRHGSFVG